MNYKKKFLLCILVVSISIAGCLADSQDNQKIEDGRQTKNSNENTNEPHSVHIVNSEPIKYENVRSYEVYWDKHNHTSDILREQLGENIKVYCYSLSYTGKLEEVGKYYILLDDASRGLMYVDIDQITTIIKGPYDGVTAQSRDSASPVQNSS